MKTTKTTQNRSPIANTDYVLLALLLAGGAEGYVDMEHVAVLCYKLAPTQFRWTYYSYPSLDAAHHGFRNLGMRHPEYFRKPDTPKSSKRMLTAAGVRQATKVAQTYLNAPVLSARAVLAAFQSLLSEDAVVPMLPEARTASASQGRPGQRVLREIRRNPLFVIWAETGDLSEAEDWQLAELLKCLPDSAESVWRERLEKLQSQALWWETPDLTNFLAVIQKLVEGHFREATK